MLIGPILIYSVKQFIMFDVFFYCMIKCYIIVADMRRDVQEIYRNTPHGKQVMMFSATLSKEIRPVCKKFMQDVIENYSPT